MKSGPGTSQYQSTRDEPRTLSLISACTTEGGTVRKSSVWFLRKECCRSFGVANLPSSHSQYHQSALLRFVGIATHGCNQNHCMSRRRSLVAINQLVCNVEI